MRKSRRNFNLAEETTRADSGSDIGVHYLDRHPPAVFEILAQVDCRHSTRANLGKDLVMGNALAGKCHLDYLSSFVRNQLSTDYAEYTDFRIRGQEKQAGAGKTIP